VSKHYTKEEEDEEDPDIDDEANKDAKNYKLL
jgi:hypothetical protein